ncbi:hypothetical protein SESBI_39575 [Sesbania bispinosa]|nr:hypothetical protein SESBI_39575 [Sesbania bispinosa]
MGPSLLRSRARREEFPWSAILFASRSTSTGCWSEWVDHVFTNDPPFVDILTQIGVADAIKLSTRLGTYRRLEDLDFLVQRCRDFLVKLRATPLPPADSSSKTPPRKVRGTGNVLPPERRKTARESLKYTYAWVRYFFGDYDVNKLKAYVFPSLPCSWEVSMAVGRLDQIQDQMFTSFRRFPINSFIDLVFLQYFLYERFPEYALVRTIPKPPQVGESRPLEPRAWGWSMGHPRQLLSELLDEEDQFVHRPYTLNFFPSMETIHPLYQQSVFSSRNNKASRSEGVFDLWQLIL